MCEFYCINLYNNFIRMKKQYISILKINIVEVASLEFRF